ncbi:hypothetical protein BC830DRAFT_1125409 [Chytriomyces sp. MP71]|nr:hypothetical protein BC830DRAFT_1125409 [Chytriomyces sp. MP71]
MAFVQSIVLREKSLHDVNPALGSQHSDLHHRYFIVHKSDGHSETVEYGHFEEGSETGTIRIRDGAETIHAMVEAHEFEVEDGKGYEWSKFKEWILRKSGYQNTAWTKDHNSETFNAHCFEHLLKHTSRPERLEKQYTIKLDVKPANEEAKVVFMAVRADVVIKFHQLHHLDAVHHTHVFQQVGHLECYDVKQYATHEVEYGFEYFGKVAIDAKGNFLHVRAHRFHDPSKGIEFHSIRMTRDCGIWSDAAKLVYFEE